MKDLETICRNALSLGTAGIADAFPGKAKELLDEIGTRDIDGMSGTEVFVRFALVSVATDGVMALEEFYLLRPFFEKIANKSVEYDEAVQRFMGMRLNTHEGFVNALRSVSKFYDMLTAEQQERFLEISVMICAVDDRITDEEMMWLKYVQNPSSVSDIDAVVDTILSTPVSPSVNSRWKH